MSAVPDPFYAKENFNNRNNAVIFQPFIHIDKKGFGFYTENVYLCDHYPVRINIKGLLHAVRKALYGIRPDLMIILFMKKRFIMADEKKKNEEEKKGFIAEFKEFISRGNVMDMAVGIIIGTAFTAIVTSLVGDILTPVIGCILGGIDFSSLAIEFEGIGGLPGAKIGYGAFIQTIINFLITAFAVFCMIKAINKLSRLRKKEEEDAEEEEEEEEPEPSAEEKLLTEIRDLLKEQNRK